MRRSICGRRGRRGEEGSLSAWFVRGLVHFVFHFVWLPNGVSELDDEVVVEVVFVWGLRLLGDA